MFETGMRQLSMARSLIMGSPFNVHAVEALVGDALATLREFGAPGDDVQQLLDGPFADPEIRRTLQDRALRRTVRRAATLTPYYRTLVRETGLDAKRVGVDTIAQLPLTGKDDLLTHGRQFLADGSIPFMTTRTTGTSGTPVQVWMSQYEARLWPALAALAGVLRAEIGPSDVLQVNISSRATAAIHHDSAVCRLVGARLCMLGLIPPRESLKALRENGATLLSTYPSYLAQLIEIAERTSQAPTTLRRIDCGGEVLSPALAARAHAVLGAPVVDTFAMTEVLPVSARRCSASHLHHDLNSGYVEVLALDADTPVSVGELGRVVITPYYPLRECMPVLRYDTGDVVRPVPASEVTCELAGMPATTSILGRTSEIRAASGHGLTPRMVIEALDTITGPAGIPRFVIQHEETQAIVIVDADTLHGHPASALAEALHRAGARANVEVLARTADPLVLRTVRADLRETTFTQIPAPTKLTAHPRTPTVQEATT